MALVRKDLHFLDIQYSDEYLAMLSNKEISPLVRRSVENRKHEFLLKLQANHSKSSKLEISGQISEYLISKKLSNARYKAEISNVELRSDLKQAHKNKGR